MFKGYVSSDSDDLDDLDLFYSEPPVKQREEPVPLTKVQNEKLKEKLNSAKEEQEKIDLFLEAADSGDLGVIEELIQSGVSVDCSKPNEWTPLLRACGAGNFEVVQFLLEHGSNPNFHKELITPLMVCCNYSLTPESSKLNCVRLLLQHGADVNEKDKYGTTALMYACESNYKDIVTELLGELDIQINLKDKDGLTALHYAVNSNNQSIAEKLMSAGADLTLTDRHNRTVVHLALENDLQEMAKLLGYVEEKETQFQENEIEPSYRFLKQLPDSSGKGGFESDVKLILASLGQQDVKEISFPDFLNITDKGLYNIGVKLKPQRQKILSLIHRFHLHPWTKFSIHEIKLGEPLSIEDAVAITGDVAKHLTLANASLQYLDSKLNSRIEKECDSETNEKELIITLTEIYQTAEKMNVILEKILNHISQIAPEVMDDYIFPYKEKKKSKFLKCLWYSCVISAVGFILKRFTLKL